jgi:Flp pilus assembly protein TadD
VQTDAANAEAYALSGRALYLKGDFEQAEGHLRRVLQLDPDDAQAGKAFKRLRQVHAAVATAR